MNMQTRHEELLEGIEKGKMRTYKMITYTDWFFIKFVSNIEPSHMEELKFAVSGDVVSIYKDNTLLGQYSRESFSGLIDGLKYVRSIFEKVAEANKQEIQELPAEMTKGKNSIEKIGEY